DFRTDVFSVGILLYQLATGDLPFRGKNPHEVLKRISEARYVDPRIARAQVGERLGRIIERALAREPEKRYPDVALFLHDLSGYLEEIDVTTPRAELRAYFASPKQYARDFEPRLLEALVRGAERANSQGKRAQALELLNRALTIKPQLAQA